MIAGRFAGQIGVHGKVGEDARVANAHVSNQETLGADDASQLLGIEEVFPGRQAGAVGGEVGVAQAGVGLVLALVVGDTMHAVPIDVQSVPIPPEILLKEARRWGVALDAAAVEAHAQPFFVGVADRANQRLLVARAVVGVRDAVAASLGHPVHVHHQHRGVLGRHLVDHFIGWIPRRAGDVLLGVPVDPMINPLGDDVGPGFAGRGRTQPEREPVAILERAADGCLPVGQPST